ncbi:MAG: hypothetical protein EOP06_00810 [Proteobacteria bacterium]|jgi:hypothetical protein|nr:MAG: hypothetical protein EOP06_00810 [Pseudomonadota bacterium]
MDLSNLTTTLPGHPLAKLAYTLVEPHLFGYRLQLGFGSREEAGAASDWLFDQIRQATIADTGEVRQLADRLAKLNCVVFSGRNVDCLDAIDTLIECANNIDVLMEQLARQQAEKPA